MNYIISFLKRLIIILFFECNCRLKYVDKMFHNKYLCSTKVIKDGFWAAENIWAQYCERISMISFVCLTVAYCFA